MWEVLQDVARNITLILDHTGGSHRKCPRCRGSGLLDNAIMKWTKNEAQDDQPCWFCEGIGVLPTAGLDGFVLARVKPCLKAVNRHKHYFKETSHLSDRSYGKEPIKFTKRKLNVNFADLVFDCKVPEIDEHRNGASSVEIQQGCWERSRAQRNSMRSCKWEQKLQLNSGLGLLQPVSRIESSKHAVESVLDYSATNVLCPSVELQLSSPFSGAVLALHVNKTADNSCSRHYIGAGSARRISFTRRPMLTVSAIDVNDSGTEVSGQYISMRRNCEANSCVVSTKRRRPIRRTRNCVREKATKEAMERARCLVRHLKFHNVDDSLSADLYQESECKKSIVQGPLLPNGMEANTACLSSVAEHWQSWSHQMLLMSFLKDDPKRKS
ncbi:hypothetical protein GOP47_0020353 [Adiantum capillus-veneris]|uniref:Uncharacterized protein n=1 Tax=Adiantum capillus-veneris TaxID=13818 RepID=A0A9D4UDS9_ADICA|nr:hypothetical protein GOP47_0019864 [Adiantum capillus-veneris]KAI5065658.1 hypothetical protein GOP47_0020353 [Adiantum capillus-veneris]